jgi:hypothetical protein
MSMKMLDRKGAAFGALFNPVPVRIFADLGRDH